MTGAEAVRELLFGDVLACEEVRPAVFLPGRVDPAQQRALGVRAEALLRALAVVEDSVRHDEEPSTENAFRRLEAKVDLLTSLVAVLAGSQGLDQAHALLWSAKGVRLAVDAPLDPHTAGLFRVLPAEWLPSPLVLPGTVVLCERDDEGRGCRAWVRFDALSPGLNAALERHLFRIHRRAVAESRRAG